MEGIDDVYEAEGFDRCCLGLDEMEMDDLVETLPVAEYDTSEALVEADISDPLLFVEATDNRAIHQLAVEEGSVISSNSRVVI